MNNLPKEKEPTGQLEKKSAKKQILSNDLLRKFLMLVFVGIFLFSLFKIVGKLYAYHKENKQYEDMRASIQSHSIVPDFLSPALTQEKIGEVQENTQSMTLPYTVLKGNPDELNTDGIFNVYSSLKEQNSDLMGWISVPGFKKVIDYPVMQSFDNEFYMTHDFYKNKSNSGSIFMDAANLNSEPDRNIILYGHAMRNNSMFGNLRGYPKDVEKYSKNTTIYLDLLSTHLEYQVFSAYSTESDFNYRRTVFKDDVDYLSFLNTVKSKSEHDFGITLSPKDKIVTLSTCDKSYGNDGRIAIHAKLVKQIVYDDSSIEGEYAKEEGKSDKKIITSNVYLEMLLLQYQEIYAEDSRDNAEDQTSAQSPGEPSGDVLPPVSDTLQVSDTIPAPDEGKSGENPAILWKDAVFDPPFSTANAIFTAKVPASAALAKLTTKAYDQKARLSYTINGESADPESLVLVDGENVITVRVLSTDGLYARIYTINVLKEPSPIIPIPEQTPVISVAPLP